MSEEYSEKGFNIVNKYELGRNEAPTIELPAGSKNREALQTKLEEYKGRLEIEPEYADTVVKIALIERLLATGVVDKAAFYSELDQKYENIDSFTFRNACGSVEKIITFIN